MTCPLCVLVADPDADVILRTETLVLTTCNKCKIPLFISTRHCKEFPAPHKAQINAIAKRLYPGKWIRWEMRKIQGHAHCHVETGG